MYADLSVFANRTRFVVLLLYLFRYWIRLTSNGDSYQAEENGVEQHPSVGTSDRIIRERECAQISGLSRTRRWELEQQGKFPRRRKLSERASGYLLSEVLAWVRSRPQAMPASTT